jgi:hypothetical protein
MSPIRIRTQSSADALGVVRQHVAGDDLSA